MSLSAEKTLRDIAVLLAGEGAGGQSSAEHALTTIRTAIANAGGGAAKTLADLTDVALTSPADGDDLTYDQATSKWVNAQPGGATGGVFWRQLADGVTLTTGAEADFSFAPHGHPSLGPDFTESLDLLLVAVPTDGLYQLVLHGRSNNNSAAPANLYVSTTAGDATGGWADHNVVLLPSVTTQEWSLTEVAWFTAGETFGLHLGNFGAGTVTVSAAIITVVRLPVAA